MAGPRYKRGAGKHGNQTLAQITYYGRTGRGLSRAEVAEYVGCSRAFVSQVERGVRPLTAADTVRKFSEILQVPEDYIYEAQGYIPQDLQEKLANIASRDLKRLRWAIDRIYSGELFADELDGARQVISQLPAAPLIARRRSRREEKAWESTLEARRLANQAATDARNTRERQQDEASGAS